VTSEKSDHDLLIEISTLVRVNNDQFTTHLEDCAVKFGDVNGKVTAAHRRIDWLLVSGVLTVSLFIASMLYALNHK